MKERPILFSGPMVRAIFEGRKAQTRRVMTPQPRPFVQATPDPRGMWTRDDRQGADVGRCPYGKPGDRLWVRETWAADSALDELSPKSLGVYQEIENVTIPLWYPATDGDDTHWRGKLRPSIYMPRWASRITLAVTSFRVERLQEISEADALAEGIQALQMDHGSALPRFEGLWQSINGKRPGCSWSANPWVWVVGFDRIEVPRA